MVGGVLDDTAKLITAVKRQLSGRKPKPKTGLLEFTETLYARGAREDLDRLKAVELADLASDLFGIIQKRKPGSEIVHVANEDFDSLSDSPITVINLINDNMPFLLDSTMDLLQARGHTVRLVLHPIIKVERDRSGKLTAFGENINTEQVRRESVMHIQIDRIEASEDLATLEAEIKTVLVDVRLAVEDWRKMRARLQAAVDEFKNNPPPIPVDEIAEAIQFLEWLLDNNFTLLGMREYAFKGDGKSATMNRIDATALGILKDPDVQVLRRGGQMVTITPEIQEFLRNSNPLIVTKANVQSNVHRRAHMDYIGIKIFDRGGNLEAELRVVGLFTSTAYVKSVLTIPFIRKKADQVIRDAAVDIDSHTGKALVNVLENYPRDELFQIDPKLLYDFSFAVMQLDERPRIRVLARPDKFDRFVSVLVYVPRDRYNTNARVVIGDYLGKVFKGRLSAFYPSFPEGTLARVHYIIGRDADQTPVVKQTDLEAEIEELVRTWQDDLRYELTSGEDSSHGRQLFKTYGDAFSEAYKEAFSAKTAVDDIGVVETLNADNPFAISFHDKSDDDDESVNLTIYNFRRQVPLSDRMPIIENMGFRAINERTYRIKRKTGDGTEKIWVHDIALDSADGSNVNLAKLKMRLEDAFLAVWLGEAEDDGYAALTLNAELSWRDVAMLRALSRYLRQVRLPFSQDYMWQTLNRHHGLARLLIDYFHVRFNPDKSLSRDMRDARETTILNDIEEGLQAVSSLDEDRIIRRFLNLMQSILRTNLFQTTEDGGAKPTLVFKFNPAEVEGLPEPRPYREIFVYSPRVEGVHLRGGPIARGGLRWSDRPQDFRTEVLGLAKAQQVKNAVIVPVGAKGGFVPKKLPEGGSRDEVFHEGRESYKIFINSLLDVTDNLDSDKVIPPRDVTRLDGNDPYLVVAADKGTATFSDTANAISQEHGFWLDDAFASGGSAGYDHKKMGITARGGWEAVKRHFREMDIDIQSEPFTVIGCGDMSGDVFGNGMLLSKKIRLIAAFDHRDIFIDPDPDPAKTFKERKRLFELGRSSWQDYNKKLISRGGGILSRSQKALQLTPQMQTAIGIDKAHVSPFELISAILKMNADLLWFGGIGTYIRAASESDTDVGDKANDPVRITAKELNVKVIGEGANLGLTHKARIAFAQNGGRINTDAIDNSAGVNSSDVEVNIKIALGQAVRDGRLTTATRNKLLASMTDEVASLVLRNNYLQTLALSMSQERGLEETEFHARFMSTLESQGILDREVEDLPDAATLQTRIENGQPLTRPELAVVLAYAKITLFDELLASPVPDDPYLAKELIRYFPTKMQRTYRDTIEGHRLRREIIATMLSNSMINRGGPVFVHRIADQTGADVAAIANAFAITRDSYKMADLNARIDALDAKVPGALQLELYQTVQDVLWRQTQWFLHNVKATDGVESQVNRFQKGLSQLSKALNKVLPDSLSDSRSSEMASLIEKGVPADLAADLTDLPLLTRGTDIIRVAEDSGATVQAAARVYFAVGDRFGTDRLVRSAAQLDLADYYDRIAANRALENVWDAQRKIAAAALLGFKKSKGPVEAWAESLGSRVTSTHRAVSEIAQDGALSVSKLAVAAGMLRDLVND